MVKTKRNSHNNPGGIRSGKGFARYKTLEEGYTALNSLLYRRYDHMTLREMFRIYAPSSDGNRPSAYAEVVRKYLKKQGYNVDYETVLDFSDAEFRGAFTAAISIQETGEVLGGEAFAMAQAKAYDPKKDTRQTYSNTEKRRQQRQGKKTQSKAQNESTDDGVTLDVKKAQEKAKPVQKEGAQKLSSVLKTHSEMVKENPVQQPIKTNKER